MHKIMSVMPKQTCFQFLCETAVMHGWWLTIPNCWSIVHQSVTNVLAYYNFWTKLLTVAAWCVCCKNEETIAVMFNVMQRSLSRSHPTTYRHWHTRQMRKHFYWSSMTIMKPATSAPSSLQPNLKSVHDRQRIWFEQQHLAREQCISNSSSVRWWRTQCGHCISRRHATAAAVYT